MARGAWLRKCSEPPLSRRSNLFALFLSESPTRVDVAIRARCGSPLGLRVLAPIPLVGGGPHCARRRYREQVLGCPPPACRGPWRARRVTVTVIVGVPGGAMRRRLGERPGDSHSPRHSGCT